MKKIMLLFLAAGLMAGCSSDPSPEQEKNSPLSATGSKTSKKANNSIQFKINGQQVHTSGWTISRFTFPSDPQHEWLNITTDMKIDKRTINVNLNGSAAGTYSFEEKLPDLNKSHGSFYPDYLNDMGNTYSFSIGSFTITAIDTVRYTVNAIFKGMVKNLKGETFEITDGEISDGLLNRNVIRY